MLVIDLRRTLILVRSLLVGFSLLSYTGGCCRVTGLLLRQQTLLSPRMLSALL